MGVGRYKFRVPGIRMCDANDTEVSLDLEVGLQEIAVNLRLGGELIRNIPNSACTRWINGPDIAHNDRGQCMTDGIAHTVESGQNVEHIVQSRWRIDPRTVLK